MVAHTTITVSGELKEELDAGREEGETWNEYLRRLNDDGASRSRSGPTSGLSEADREELRGVFRDVAADPNPEGTDRDHADRVDLDYDLLREIVREEVQRALEDVVR